MIERKIENGRQRKKKKKKEEKNWYNQVTQRARAQAIYICDLVQWKAKFRKKAVHTRKRLIGMREGEREGGRKKHSIVNHTNQYTHTACNSNMNRSSK